MDFTIPTSSRKKRRTAWDEESLEEQWDEQAGVKDPQSGLGQTSEGEEVSGPVKPTATPRKDCKSPFDEHARLDVGGLNLSCGFKGSSVNYRDNLESFLCCVLNRGLDSLDRVPNRAHDDTLITNSCDNI